MTRHVLIILLFTLLLAACSEGNFDEGLATTNALATSVAGAPETDYNLFDLSGDPNALLISAWSDVARLPGGSPFTITATQNQVQTLVIQRLQLQWKEAITSGALVMDAGQIRLDLDVVDQNDAAGRVTLSYQPTLDSRSQVLLNAQPDLGGLNLQTGMLASFGEAVLAALTGAPAASMSEVTLISLSFQAGILQVDGTRN